jgi:hygromycin-B 7''-O-kinase
VPVYAVGSEHVLKLFPSKDRAFFETERAALACIDGSLSLPTPRLLDSGEKDGFFYVAMTQLRGISLAQAWPAIPGSERARLLQEVGAALAELHRSSTADLPELSVDWAGFMASQRETCRARQQSKELPEPWLEQVDDFLTRHAIADDGRRSLLHTEVMREQLLVEQRGSTWQLSGLVDFEPAMCGAPEYELSAVGVFATCAEPGLLRAFLAGYGSPPDADLPMRIMVYSLLHRYSNLRWYMNRLSVGDATTLEQLAVRWFSPE